MDAEQRAREMLAHVYCCDVSELSKDEASAARAVPAYQSAATPPKGYVTREDMLAAQDQAFYDGLSKAEPAVPEGYVLVPMEMTEAMQRAGAGIVCTDVEEIRQVWAAILAVRPEVK